MCARAGGGRAAFGAGGACVHAALQRGEVGAEPGGVREEEGEKEREKKKKGGRNGKEEKEKERKEREKERKRERDSRRHRREVGHARCLGARERDARVEGGTGCGIRVSGQVLRGSEDRNREVLGKLGLGF